MKHPAAEQLEWTDGRSILLTDGSEVPDPKPMSVPVGFERPESIQELIRRLVTDPAIREQLASKDVESFEDSDDFDVPDDVPLVSPYEEQFDPLHLTAHEQEIAAGAVRPRTVEEVEAARKVLADHKAALDAAQLAKQAAKSEAPVHTT